MSERRTDIVEETKGYGDWRGNVVVFPANVVAGALFLSVNEVNSVTEESDTAAIYLTPDECETLGTVLFRQAAYLREKG